MIRILKDRRRAQAGTTLVEVLVALTIASLSLALIVGTLSTGLLDATLAKRNTAANAALQYESEQIAAAPFDPSPSPRSDCFATETTAAPAAATAYQGSCPSASYAVRADASMQWLPGSSSVQVWTVSIADAQSGVSIGLVITVYKINR